MNVRHAHLFPLFFPNSLKLHCLMRLYLMAGVAGAEDQKGEAIVSERDM